jgi:hypothetical protein
MIRQQIESESMTSRKSTRKFAALWSATGRICWPSFRSTNDPIFHAEIHRPAFGTASQRRSRTLQEMRGVRRLAISPRLGQVIDHKGPLPHPPPDRSRALVLRWLGLMRPIFFATCFATAAAIAIIEAA